MLAISSGEDLKEKYGRFAHSSWLDEKLCLRKMDAIRTELKDEAKTN